MKRVLSLSLLLLSGCLLGNASSTKKLTDTVHEMNKAVRWGSLGMAIRMVEPGYRERFLHSHRHWGQLLQVADTDVVQLEIAPGGDSAIAVIAYQWYQADTMTLSQTVVQQRWSKSGRGFALSGESVVQGDARLFQPQASTPAGMNRPSPVSALRLE